MVNQLIRQLESPDPKQRIKAIKALAKTGDRAALEPLLKVYKSDSDAQVRELALKAGRYIKNRAGTQSPSRPVGASSSGEFKAVHVDQDAYEDDDTGDADYSYYDDDDDTDDDGDTYDEDEDAGGYEWDGDTSHRQSFYADSITDTMMMRAVGFSTQDQNRALTMLDEVETYRLRGQKDQAIKVLSEAMQMDPKLWKNSYAVGLVRAVTKLSPGEAYPLLMGDQAAKRKKGKKKASRHPDDVTWGDAFVDLIIYGVVFALLVLIPGILGLDFLKESFESAGNARSLGLSQQEYNDFKEVLDTLTPVVMAVIAVACGVFMAVSLFIQDIGIHIAALIVFSGDGGLKELIRKTTLFYTFCYAIMGIMFFSIFWPGLLSDQWRLNILVAIGMAAMLVYIWSLKLISDVYHFGMAKGCGAVFIGGIIVNVAISWMTSQLAGVSLY